jgi:hypothetical protein
VQEEIYRVEGSLGNYSPNELRSSPGGNHFSCDLRCRGTENEV